MANPKLTQLTTPILRRHLASFVEENDNGASGVLGLRICTASGTGAVLVSQVLVHGVVTHVQLVVPPGYPLLPPEVRVKGRLPHLNLDSRRPPDASGYYPLTDVWRCGSKEGWSSGYGLLHALLHVRLFLEGFMQLGGAAGVQEGSGPGSGEGDYEAAAAVLRGMQLELQDPGWESYSTQWPLSQVEQRPRQVEGQKLKGKAPATTAASAAATITATAPAPAEDDGEAAEEGWQRVLSRRSKRGAGAQAAHSGGRKAVSGSASASAAFPPPLPAPPASSVLDVLYKALQPLEARGLLSNADIAVAKHSLGERAPAPSLQRASQELRCWYTGLGHSQALLCLPLNFTVNPKTRRTDYLLPCFDGYLSLAAFEAGVRKTPAGDAFTHVLPLYISEEHYTQGGEWQLAALCSATGLQRLDLMATLFSTSAVMLADGGVPPSERVLAVLVQVMLLSDKVCRARSLYSAIDRSVDAFLRDPQQRSKSATPNLGLFAALLAVMGHKQRFCLGPHPGRTSVAPALMMESFVRNVLWVCKEQPEAVPLLKGGNPTQGSQADELLAAASFQGSKNSIRLMCIFRVLEGLVLAEGGSHAGFMAELGASLGLPSVVHVRRFRCGVQAARGMGSWPQALSMLGLKDLGTAGIARQMRRAWQLSLEAGYHAADTNFADIHRSGVSKLLLKGETFSGIGPGTHHIKVTDSWKWATPSTQFLDATLFAVDAQGAMVDYMDYAKQDLSCVSRFTGHTGACARHSGDVMSFKSGQHVMDIWLETFPPQVVALFVVVSAWHVGGRLSHILQPSVSIQDPKAGMELCRYALEERPAAERKAMQAVVLCSFVRRGARWDVRAIGKTCMGNALDYAPIRACIQSLVLKDM